MDEEFTKSKISELFFYKNGELFWKKSRGGILCGSRAGYKNGNGYRYIRINGKMYLEHRIVFLMHNDYLPEFIDHINTNREDNRIENLRECTRTENNRNSSGWGKTGVKGVHWNKKNKKYTAQITVDRKVITVGNFKNLCDAELAITDARNKYHGKFARQ